MSEIPFPGSAVDGSTFFHDDMVCVYHEPTNTWECRAISTETPQPSTNFTVHTNSVRVLNDVDGDLREQLKTALRQVNPVAEVRPLQTQFDVNRALIDIIVGLAGLSSSGGSTPDLSDFITATVLEARLSGLATANDFTALAATVTAAVNLQAQNQINHTAATDAKFDQIRAAVNESTDFNTLKARLLAVLS